MTLTRLQSALSYGLGQGWQIRGILPVDIKFLGIDYSLPDGSPYTPPYRGLHHRNETLVGLADARFEFQYFERLKRGWVLGAGFGTTLPFGRTEENPYDLATKSFQHQHVQMGSDTFNPTFSFSAVWSGMVWGMTTFVNGELAIYANGKKYRPPSRISIATGPTYRVTAKLMLTAEVSFSHATQAEWDAEPDPQSGQTLSTAGGSIIYRFNPQLATMFQVRTTVLQWTEKAVIRQPLVGSIGVTWTPQGKTPDN